MSTCEGCHVMEQIKNSKESAACAWYIDNVVFGTKTVADCPHCGAKMDGGTK